MAVRGGAYAPSYRHSSAIIGLSACRFFAYAGEPVHFNGRPGAGCDAACRPWSLAGGRLNPAGHRGYLLADGASRALPDARAVGASNPVVKIGDANDDEGGIQSAQSGRRLRRSRTGQEGAPVGAHPNPHADKPVHRIPVFVPRTGVAPDVGTSVQAEVMVDPTDDSLIVITLRNGCLLSRGR
jgi:hypothetical protein